MTRAHGHQTPRIAALMGCLLLSGSLLAGLPAAAAATPPRPLIDLIHVENGTKDALDGGDYTAIAVGDQLFGVLYGSADHPLSAVTLFTMFTRSLGTATVRDAASGNIVARNVSLPVRTLLAERFEAAFEFRDMNGDGMFNFRPNHLNSSDPFDLNASEPLVKGASLAGDWNLTGFDITAVSENEVRVSFTLSLDGTGYRMAFDHAADGDGVLNRVAFTIHLDITRTHVDATDAPHFEATVDRSGGKRQLTGLVADGTAPASYTSTHATFKVDHDLTGWDFSPPRQNVSSKLMLVTTLVYLNAIDERLAAWLSEAALAQGRDGAANVTTDHSNVTVDVARPLADFRPANAVGLVDHWHRIGGLAWVSNASLYPTDASADPTPVTVNFQVLGGARRDAPFDGHAFHGIVLLGGFVYPAGYRIVHDPLLEASSVEPPGGSVLPPIIATAVLLGEFALTAAAVVGAILFAARAVSNDARTRAAEEATRLEALRARYKLPEGPPPPRRGGSP